MNERELQAISYFKQVSEKHPASALLQGVEFALLIKEEDPSLIQVLDSLRFKLDAVEAISKAGEGRHKKSENAKAPHEIDREVTMMVIRTVAKIAKKFSHNSREQLQAYIDAHPEMENTKRRES